MSYFSTPPFLGRCENSRRRRRERPHRPSPTARTADSRSRSRSRRAHRCWPSCTRRLLSRRCMPLNTHRHHRAVLHRRSWWKHLWAPSRCSRSRHARRRSSGCRPRPSCRAGRWCRCRTLRLRSACRRARCRRGRTARCRWGTRCARSHRGSGGVQQLTRTASDTRNVRRMAHSRPKFQTFISTDAAFRGRASCLSAAGFWPRSHRASASRRAAACGRARRRRGPRAPRGRTGDRRATGGPST